MSFKFNFDVTLDETPEATKAPNEGGEAGQSFAFNFDVADDDAVDAAATEQKSPTAVAQEPLPVPAAEAPPRALDPISIHHILVLFLRVDAERVGRVKLGKMEEIMSCSDKLKEDPTAAGLIAWAQDSRRARWSFSFPVSASSEAKSTKSTNSDDIDPSTWLSAVATALPKSQQPTNPTTTKKKNDNSPDSTEPVPNPLTCEHLSPSMSLQSPSAALKDFLAALETCPPTLLPPLEAPDALNLDTAPLVVLAVAHASAPMVSYVLREFKPKLEGLTIPLPEAPTETITETKARAVDMQTFLEACDALRAKKKRKGNSEEEDEDDDDPDDGETPILVAPSSLRAQHLSLISDLLYPPPPTSPSASTVNVAALYPTSWIPLPHSSKPPAKPPLGFPSEFEAKLWKVLLRSEGVAQLAEAWAEKKDAQARGETAVWMHDVARCGGVPPSALIRVLDALGREGRPRAIEAIGVAYNHTLAPAGSDRPYCHVCGRVVCVTRCPACGVTGYCRGSHLTDAAEFHAKWCKSLQISRVRPGVDEIDFNRGLLSWSGGVEGGWKGVFGGGGKNGEPRGPTKEQVEATETLSFPLTLAFALKRLSERMRSKVSSRSSSGARVCVHVVGAAGKESKVRWNLIAEAVPQWISHLHLILIGPEMATPTQTPPRSKKAEESRESSAEAKKPGLKITVDAMKGVYHLLGRDEPLPRPHLVVAFNSGIHHYGSWERTITCILRSPLQPDFVVTAWNLTEAVVVRQILQDHGGIVIEGMDVTENEFSSLLPKEIMDDHGTCAYDNRYWIAVRGTPVKKMVAM